MFGADFLRIVVEYYEEIDANGALIPSPQSKSGCRSVSTINNWIERLCELSNMEFDRVITVQNFRQFWKNNYRKALHENREYIKFVTEEDKKKDFLSDEEDYIDDVVNRRMVRDIGRTYFDNVINITAIPDPIQQQLDPDIQFGKDANLTSY
jgi:hypothetical protein